MEIAFFTEMGFTGKIPRTHDNMRTEFAWMCALDATHHPLGLTLGDAEYDLGIVILPKNGIDSLMQLDRISYWKQHCKKIAIMQEGPNWYWQDYSLEQQIWYFNTIQEVDFMFVHNETDKNYFTGLTGKECKVLPSLMIEDSISNLPLVDRSNVIIGGNFCSWYGGFDSYMVAQEFDCPIHIPTMGRKIEGEEQMENLNHLPYMNWVEWIKVLHTFKYGVHLMRTHAAGTFALNCAYLGIPCIGYEGLDTQQICHPETTVELGDLERARGIAKKLRNDEKFYVHCSKVAKENYLESYHENNFTI